MNAPDAQHISSELCRFVSDQLFGDGRAISADAPLADVGLDSFALMELVLFIEQRFAIQIPLASLTPDNVRTATSLSECALAAKMSYSLVREK